MVDVLDLSGRANRSLVKEHLSRTISIGNPPPLQVFKESSTITSLKSITVGTWRLFSMDLASRLSSELICESPRFQEC